MASKSKRNRRQPRAAKRRQPQRSQAIYVIGGAAVLVVALVGYALFQVAGGAGTASDFEFSVYQGEEVLGGTEVNFQDLLGSKPVVLNFWAGNCPPCRGEMPALQRVYDKHGDDIVFLGLDVGIFTGLGTRSSGLALLNELDITYPAGAPPDRKAVSNYTVVSMPTTVFFGADGDVFRRWDGAIQESQMNDIVEAMLDAA